MCCQGTLCSTAHPSARSLACPRNVRLASCCVRLISHSSRRHPLFPPMWHLRLPGSTWFMSLLMRHCTAVFWSRLLQTPKPLLIAFPVLVHDQLWTATAPLQRLVLSSVYRSADQTAAACACCPSPLCSHHTASPSGHGQAEGSAAPAQAPGWPRAPASRPLKGPSQAPSFPGRPAAHSG